MYLYSLFLRLLKLATEDGAAFGSKRSGGRDVPTEACASEPGPSSLGRRWFAQPSPPQAPAPAPRPALARLLPAAGPPVIFPLKQNMSSKTCTGRVGGRNLYSSASNTLEQIEKGIF